MTKKMISWLSFMAVFLFLLHSCVHDEIYSSSDPASAEYHSKSLWKEDEKYIKNVMKIYSEHEDNIKKFSGTPDWDYAMSMGKYDESFMVVPIIENGKVVNTLACARFDKKVYFRYENSKTNNAFFQNIIYGKYTRYKTEADNTKTNTQKGIVCITKTISMWYPDNESNPNAGGHWETNYYTNCYNYLDYSSPGWEDNGGGGYDYGGGGGSGNNDPNNPNNQTPCEKTKNIVNKPQIKAKLTSLQSYANTNTKIENGFQELKSGTLVNGVVNGDNQIEFGIGPNSQGTVHTHQPGTIGIFAPQDIMTFLAIVHAQDANALGNAYSGTISSSGTYFINFTGTASDLPPATTETQEAAYVAATVKDYTEKYYKLLKAEEKKSYQTLSSIGLEKLFFDMLDKIGLAGKITLIKEDNGNTSTIQKDSSGNPIPNPC
ncbi:hypothetical protein [uncultured Chryseobacterium sp.]|uniref:hypothetical protein n=1 Tax=uncultured Chryseobacterium sp. TaxID=259322 RepID=UPI0025D39E9C|nr:hypothetical protein [uncultured Chryseobacterium sp.]